MGMTGSDTGIQTERNCYEMKLSPESNLASDVHLMNGIICFSPVKSKNDIDMHEMGSNQMEIKQEPCLLEKTLDKMKSESKGAPGSDIYIKREPHFASDFIDHSHSNKEMDTKIEIKEEPMHNEITFPKVKSEPEEIQSKDVDLHSDTQDNATRGDQEFFWSSATRLNTKISRDCAPGVFSEELKNDCIELNYCHEKPNTDAVQVFSKLGAHSLIPKHKLWLTGDRCHKSFTTSSCLKAHKLINMDKTPYKCVLCVKSFTRSEDFKAHNLIHEEKRPFKCSKCDKSFNTAHNLKAHNLIHKEKRPFKCNKCDKSFITGHSLKAHNLIHDGKRLFKCNKCEKSFTTTCNLKAHYLIHEEKFPFDCNKCDKSFTASRCLKLHTLTHDGIRPFQCHKCAKSFSSPQYLKLHILIHEGRKPFKCSKCDKSFTSAWHLKKHSFIHNGTVPLVCTKCDKNFITISNLKRHYESFIHENRKPMEIRSQPVIKTRSYNLRHIGKTAV